MTRLRLLRPIAARFALVSMVLGSCEVRSALAEPSSARSLGSDGAWGLDSPPGLIQGASAIYDPVRQRMLVFGGFPDGSGSASNGVFALSLTGSPEWSSMAPTGVPPAPRAYQTAIYDPVRDRMLVFGGASGPGILQFLNDVWALSLSGTPAWTQLAPAGTPPIGREGATATYDPVRDRMLVFGGENNNGLNDVWALSLAGNPSWTQLMPEGPLPSGREWTSSIYDPVRDRLVVFGGFTAGLPADTWALPLTGQSWTQLAPAGALPAGRFGHSAIYDPLGDRMVVFGGVASTGGLGDVWALSLGASPSWVPIVPAGGPTATRYQHTAIYDPVGTRMVVFGGYTGGDPTLSFSLTGEPAWTSITPTPAPPSARYAHTAIRDPVRDRMLVFGGRDAGGQVNDVSALSIDGPTQWMPFAAAGTPPSARTFHSAIYDPVRDRMIVFGGLSGATRLNDTWTLSLSTGPTWQPLIPTGAPPGVRRGHSAIYDPVRDRMVIFGGSDQDYQNDVWTLSLGQNPTWLRLTPGGGPPDVRSSHTAVYDPIRERMIVFGGLNRLGAMNDVWALSLSGGPVWTRLVPTGAAPSARYAHTAVYDPVRDRMVVSAGADDHGAALGDSWSLALGDAPAWSVLAPSGPQPAPREWQTAVLDAPRDRMVMFGGSNGINGPPRDDLWELSWFAAVSVPTTPGDGGLTLAPALPNPSRGGIAIGFALARSSAATLSIYDLSGRVLRTLVDGVLPPGPRSVRWDGRGSSGVAVQPGVYFYELRADGRRLARRFAIVR